MPILSEIEAKSKECWHCANAMCSAEKCVAWVSFDNGFGYCAPLGTQIASAPDGMMCDYCSGLGWRLHLDDVGEYIVAHCSDCNYAQSRPLPECLKASLGCAAKK